MQWLKQSLSLCDRAASENGTQPTAILSSAVPLWVISGHNCDVGFALKSGPWSGEECPLGAPCDQRGFFGPNVTRHRVNEEA